jgi:mercuric ion binding protein
MKLIKSIFLLTIFVAIFSCENNEEHNEDSSAVEVSEKNLTFADYAVEGMVCAMGCAATIEKDVKGLNGVVASNVDYESGKAHFEFDNSIVSEKEIIAKIEGIANGQYKVGTWSEEKEEENEVEATDTEKPITEVTLPSFEIPNLFHLLINQL